MGIGVLDMVEMYATSICDTQTLLPKDPVESSGSCRGIKRRLSIVSEDSGRPRSPRTPTRSSRSPRSNRSDRYATSSTTSSSDRLSSTRHSFTPTTYLSTDTEDEEIVKKSRLESPSSSSAFDSSSTFRECFTSRRKRFLRTAEALRHSGLLDVTMKTAELLRKNQDLQREIENLQKETRAFVLSVLTNPENRPVLDNIRSQAQLYEIVVPGSQGIMSVTSSTSLPEHNFNCQNNLSSEDDSLASNDNVSSPSPAPTESDGASSFSDDSSSEKENLSPPPQIRSNSKQ